MSSYETETARKSIMKIALFGHKIQEKQLPFYRQLLLEIQSYSCEIMIFERLFESLRGHLPGLNNASSFSETDELSGGVDYIFSVGGDGTFLDSIRFAYRMGIPILGFNTGRLGFLSSISTDNISPALKALHDGDFVVEQRSLLSLQTRAQLFCPHNYALNEICIHKKDSASMISIQAWVNDVYLNTYWADGLIIATPTGSTAYSMSCGGPIISPESRAIIITPVATHNLTVRPIVLPDNSRIRLRPEGREDSFLVSLDSRSETAGTGMEFNLSLAPGHVNIVRLPGQNFYATIREKLMWGLDRRNY